MAYLKGSNCYNMYRILRTTTNIGSPTVVAKLPLQPMSVFDNAVCNRNHSSYNKTLVAIQNAIRKKKKVKKPRKKYTELLEVCDNKSNITKAVVKNLTADQMSRLMEISESIMNEGLKLEGTNLFKVPERLRRINATLGEQEVETGEEYLRNFHLSHLATDNTRLEERCHSDVQFTLFATKRNFSQSSVEEGENNVEITLEPDLKSGSKSKRKKKVKEGLEGKIKIAKGKLNQKSKIKADTDAEYLRNKFNQSLASYIDLCVHCGFDNRGYGTLARYMHKCKKKSEKIFLINDLYPFNSLMHGFAGKGKLDKVLEIMRMIWQCKLSPNAQTYAACFECIARLPDTAESAEQLEKCYQQLIANNFTFQDLFDKTTLLGDQGEYVLKATRKLSPGFTPKVKEVDTNYTCSLLLHLNKPKGGDSFSLKSPARDLLTKRDLEAAAKEQLAMEINSFIKIKSITKLVELTEEVIHYRKKWDEMRNGWRMSIREALAREFKNMNIQENATKLCYSINIYPYLKALPAEQYVDIVMQEIQKMVDGSETYSPSVKQLHRDLGNQVRMRYEVKFKQSRGILKKTEELYDKYCEWYLNPETRREFRNTRHCWQNLILERKHVGPSMVKDMEEKLWPSSILSQIGKFLYNIIVKDIKIDVNAMRVKNSTPNFLPAFYTIFRFQGFNMKEEIKPHPVLIRLYRATCTEDLYFDTNTMPMLCPPVPWNSISSGGYVVMKTDLIRLHYDMPSAQQWELLSEIPKADMYPTFDALNQLSAVPWMVNDAVLDVVTRVFQSGGNAQLDIPQPSSSLHSPDTANLTKFQVYKQRLAVSRKRAEMHGLWCETLYRLSLANYYKGRIFWLPHNVDFRGRVYPVPPHLNHLGSDMARSLLQFAKGEALGLRGLDWLKIHCVNLTGLKKRASTDERLAFANKILPDMLDSAEKPLDGKMWWADSDEPWQTLACCMEIKRVLDSGLGEGYVSHFPVHQDGSCNGLQHYAALGRDKAGAESVNLTPSRKPQDVYSCVVQLVEQERLKDVALGIPIATVLDGFIHRKVIKQTIMTTVYGVTRFGARLQIAKQLKDLDTFPKEHIWTASLYLVTKTFLCLQEMFTSTKEIQDWFVDCAREISQTFGRNVEWRTPLGLPVVQPYVKTKKCAFLNDMNGKINGNGLDMVEMPNCMKQKNAFPPNFIHSLDSSHMMLTSLHCEQAGITFVSVHDCFWTHPCSVPVMNRICRQQFVALHSQPILEDLSRFMLENYRFQKNTGEEVDFALTKNVFSRIPKKGDYNLNDVLRSEYFFS